MVVMLFVGGVLLIVVAIVIAGANSHKPTAEQVAQARALSQKQFADCITGGYLGPGEQAPPPYTTLNEFCRAVTTSPTPETGLKLGDAADVIQHTGTFTVLLGVVLGASLMGADWGAGTMTTLLTWEPRRIRVFLTRAGELASPRRGWAWVTRRLLLDLDLGHDVRLPGDRHAHRGVHPVHRRRRSDGVAALAPCGR